MRRSLYIAGLLVVMTAIASPAFAGNPVAVPEIDGSSVAMSLGVLSGSVLLLRARFGRKK